MPYALTIATTLLSYLLGAIPVGLVVCLPLGRDPRQVGSGRTGGTNVYRTAGLPAAVLTALGDVAKGYVAVWLTLLAFDRFGAGQPAAAGIAPWAVAISALAVIIGHNYSVFAGFKGGAGSSPNVGALLRIDPVSAVVAIAIALVVLVGVRIASVASLAASTFILVALTTRVVRGDLPPAYLLYAVGQLVLLTWALRPNIARLRAGTERRITFGRQASKAAEEA